MESPTLTTGWASELSERARLWRTGSLMRFVIDAADRTQPITMEAQIIDEGAEDLPIVEYRHSSVADEDVLPTLLCFAGGGASGAMFARLAEEGAYRGIRLVSFDMPGHTPEKLLGAATPSRKLISRANGAARLARKTMISRSLRKSTCLQGLSHSAGVVDIARIIPAHGADIARFVITGAGRYQGWRRC
jgi:alpha-beta hydrolase superfamily lysophospholipase